MPYLLISSPSGELFGTTTTGTHGTSCPDGCGTIFELLPPAPGGASWREVTLHSFTGEATGSGGAYNFGALFELKP